MSAKKATEMIRYYKNPNGPTIGVTAKDVIESDGLYFKDLNGDGTLNTYKDWRKTPSERAKALAEELSSEEKIGLLFINSLKMGAYQKDKEAVDATGLLDEKVIEKDTTIFKRRKISRNHLYGKRYGNPPLYPARKSKTGRACRLDERTECTC